MNLHLQKLTYRLYGEKGYTMKTYDISIRCYYPNGNKTQHSQTLPLKDIAKWVEAYRFTHPACKAVTFKIWLHDEEEART